MRKLLLDAVRMGNHVRQQLAKLLFAVTWKAKAVRKAVMALDIRLNHVISVCL